MCWLTWWQTLEYGTLRHGKQQPWKNYCPKPRSPPFFADPEKTRLLIAHYIVSQSYPIWFWLPFFPLPAGHIMVLWYNICIPGMISGHTELRQHKINPCSYTPLGSILVPLELAVKLQLISEEPVSGPSEPIFSPSFMPVWNYFILGSPLIEGFINLIAKVQE